MGWIKLDDGFFRNQKAVAAGLHGRALYMAGLCWISANGTDGRIPKHLVQLLTAEAGAKAGTDKVLVSVGLWDVDGDHFVVKDYLEWQRSREQIDAERDRWRKAKVRARTKDVHEMSTEDNAGSPPRSPANVTRTETEAETETDTYSSNQQQLKPFSGEHPAAAAAGSVKPLRAVAAASESAKPDLIGLAVAVREAQSEATIRNPARWRSAMRTRIADEFGEQFAAAQAETPDAEPDAIVASVMGVERFQVRAAKRGGAYL